MELAEAAAGVMITTVISEEHNISHSIYDMYGLKYGKDFFDFLFNNNIINTTATATTTTSSG